MRRTSGTSKESTHSITMMEGSEVTRGSSGNTPPKAPPRTAYPRFRRESERLISFDHWPLQYLRPEQLAAAGFFYLGQGDDVACFECGAEINNWQRGEDPMAEHRDDWPNCRFINNLPCGNITIDAEKARPSASKNPRKTAPDTPKEAVKEGKTGPTTHEEPKISINKTPSKSSTGKGSVKIVLNSQGRDHKETLEELRKTLSLVQAPIKSPRVSNKGKRTAIEEACETSAIIGKKKTTGTTEGQHLARTAMRIELAGTDPLTSHPLAQGAPTPPATTNKPRSGPSTSGVQTRSSLGVQTEARKYNITMGSTPAPDLSHVTYIDVPVKPIVEDYSHYETRIESFKEWPTAMKQTAENMADAGFFYLGVSDKVKCFRCHGLLHRWGARDDPWEEHAKWNKTCTYLLERKGKEFIERVSKKSKGEETLAKTMDCYRSFCQKRIQPIDVRREPMPEAEKEALMACIPDGFVNPSIRLDDVVFDNLCRYCGTRRVSGIYVPCAHAIACYECGIATRQCDLCQEEILFVKHIVIIPDRGISDYELLVSPIMIQEAKDLTRATIRVLQAIGKRN